MLNKSFFPKLSLHLRVVFERWQQWLRSCSSNQRLKLINDEKPSRVPDNGALMEICWSSWTKRKDKKNMNLRRKVLPLSKKLSQTIYHVSGFRRSKRFPKQKKVFYLLSSLGQARGVSSPAFPTVCTCHERRKKKD